MDGNAVCPFCGYSVMYGGVEFGESLLHEECFTILQVGMDEDQVVIESTPLRENFDYGRRDEEDD
jgi:hypothetical protein